MVAASFIGLGVMGFPMAGHLASKGHDVTVYNRNAEKSRSWVEKNGGRSAPTPREAAAGSTSCSSAWAMTTTSGR